MRLLATGDAIITRRLSSTEDAQLLEIKELMEGADVGFTNFEMALPDLPPVPASVLKGSHVIGHVGAIEDLRWLGMTVFNLANNHANDYSPSGLEELIVRLERADVAFAGAGRTLAAARAPAYLETGAGRCAVIGVSSSSAELALAADPGGFTRGRPGINPLRYGTTYDVSPERFEQLRALDEELRTAEARRGVVTTSRSRTLGAALLHGEGAETLSFADRVFRSADRTRVSTTPHQGDLEATVRAVATARALADVVVVSVHCHEGAADGWNSPQVPDFLTTATHAWIDAGADAVIGHGPHQIRGIEIYQGRPILYSLGNFAFTNATTPFLPPEGYLRQGLDPERSSLVEYADSAVGGGFPAHEQYWRSVVAQLGFDDSGVRLDLLPLSLRRDAERWVRGIPQLADEEEGRHILGILAELSAPFGTRIDVEESGSRVVGRVRMTPSRAVTTPDQEAS